MNDLTYVKEIIETLSPEKQKELFQQFISYLNNSMSVGVRPTTPDMMALKHEPSTSKRPLGSPETPKRNKKDGKVCLNLKVSLIYY